MIENNHHGKWRIQQEITGQQTSSSLKIDLACTKQDFHPAPCHAPITGQTSTLLVKFYGSNLPATQISLPSHWSLAQLKSSLQNVFSRVQAPSPLPGDSERVSLTVQGRPLSQASDTKIQDIDSLAPYSLVVCQFDRQNLPGGMSNNEKPAKEEMKESRKSIEEEASELGVKVPDAAKKPKKTTSELAAELGIVDSSVDDSRANLLKKNQVSAVAALDNETKRTQLDQQRNTIVPSKEADTKADFSASSSNNTGDRTKHNIPVNPTPVVDKKEADIANNNNKFKMSEGVKSKTVTTTAAKNTTAKKVTNNQVGIEEKASLLPKNGTGTITPTDKVTDGSKTSEEEKEDPRSLQDLLKAYQVLNKKMPEKENKSLTRSLRLSQAEKENLTEMDNLVRLIAKKQVKDYRRSEQEEEKLLEKHLKGYKPGGAHEIKSASEFINATSEARSFVEYRWATRGWQYDAFLCTIPGLKPVAENQTYKLFVRESAQYSLKRVVFGHNFGMESPPEAFSLNGNTLWILEPPDEKANQQCILMKTFFYKFGDERTDKVQERRYYLPEGVTVRRTASISGHEGSQKDNLSKNLSQWCIEAGVKQRSPTDCLKEIETEVDKMTRDNHSQILLMRYGKVFVNTNERGLVYFTMKSSVEDYQEEKLKESDLQDVADLPAGYVVTALFTDRRDNTLNIMCESDEYSKIHISVRDVVKKEYTEANVMKLERPYPIIKASYLDGGRIFILDASGEAKVINTYQESIFSVGERCYEILVTPTTFFSWRFVTNEKNQLTTILHRRLIGNDRDSKFNIMGSSLMRSIKTSRRTANKELAEKQAEEEKESICDSNMRICEILAKQDHYLSFFTHSLSIEGRMLLVNGKTIYVRNESTREWLQCFTLQQALVEQDKPRKDNHIIALYPIKDAKKKTDDEKDLKHNMLCVTEYSVKLLELNLSQTEQCVKQIKETVLPAKAISAHKVVQQTWNNSEVLIMTLGRDKDYIQKMKKEQNKKKKEKPGVKVEDENDWKRHLRLWSCAYDLKLALLLQDQDRKHLDPNSFYAYVNMPTQYFNEASSSPIQRRNESEEAQKDTLALVCSLTGFRKDFNLYPMPQPPEKSNAVTQSKKELEDQSPLISEEPIMIRGLMQLDFEHARVFQLFEVNARESESGQICRFYAMIANGEKLKTSIILLNHELKEHLHSDFDDLRITQVADDVQEEGHIFAIDDQLNLVKIDVDLLNKGGLAVYNLINFSEHGRTVLSVDNQSIWLLHASGDAQRFLKLPFTGKLQLEGSGSEIGEYLLWKQHEHLMAAVNRFNVVSFWNTLTGELFHKKIISQESHQIADARKYRSHVYQKRYEEPGKQFDSLTQTLVCQKKERKGPNDDFECYRVKIMKLHVFEENQRAFEARCELQVTAKLSQHQIVPGRTFFYNKYLSLIVATTEDGGILLFQEQSAVIDAEDCEWKYDFTSSEQLQKDIGLHEKGDGLLENHISPNGRYILHCFGGALRVYEFEKQYTSEEEVVVLVPKEWELPVRTDDLEPMDLARRVKFESNNVIRFFKPGYNRDMLFYLEPDQKTVTYLSEVVTENLFQSGSHIFQSRSFNNEFETFMQSNRLFRTSYWHRLNLDQLGGSLRFLRAEINRVDMISPVLKQEKGFEAQLAFSTFEWLQAEKVADGQIMLDSVEVKRRLQLSMGIFPQATTLLHLIASKSSKEDQSSGALQIQALLEAESAFADEEITGTEEGDQIQIPILVNQLGQTPFKQMHDTGRRVLIDKLMSKIPFHRIINYQEEVDELLQQEDPNLISFIESSLQENESTEKILSLDMPPSTYLITFRSSSTTLEQLEVQEAVDRSLKEKELAGAFDWCSDTKSVNTKVKVRFMDIRWLLRGGTTFLDFVTVLRNYKRDKLFQTDLLNSLTHEYWVVYQRKIIWRTLLPWIAFSCLSVVYFEHVLDAKFADAEGSELLTWRIIAGMLIALICYQLYIETRQIIGDFKGYFDSLYNINDLFQYLGTLWIVVINTAEYHEMTKVSQRDLATIIVLSQGVKAVIDWLRLFDVTSFYVTLIQRTVLDIGYFGLILFVMVAYIGIATYMLQLNAEAGEDRSIIQPVFANFLVDSVLNQYLLMLGEFHMDGFGGHVNTALCYSLFILTTFIMQITFLNMLIAIMGDTFDKVIDQRPTFSLKNKLMILAGMETLIRSKEDFDVSKVFLFVIQPAGAGEDGGGVDSESETWRGKVYYTHNLIKTRSAALSDEIQQIAREQKARVTALTSLIADQQGRMQKQLDDKVDRLLATTDLMLQRRGAAAQRSGGDGQDGQAEGVQGQIEGMQGKIDKMQTEMRDKFAQQEKWQAEMTQNMKTIMSKLNKD